MLACAAVAALAATSARASEYKMVACSGGDNTPPYAIATNTISPQRPGGTFDFINHCHDGGGEPTVNGSYMRIAENQPSGYAAFGAYLAVEFTPPPWIGLRAAGGYTREPAAFNAGWEAHFKFTEAGGETQLQMAEGAGLEGAGFPYFGPSSTFTPHLWPWAYGLDLDRWAFDVICTNPIGCDLAGYNAADLTGLLFTLRDLQDSQVSLTDAGSDLLAGRWVSGRRQVGWTSFDNGSGLRFERLRVDGAERYVLDYQRAGACATDASGRSAATFQPCPTDGPNHRAYDLDTASLPDGAHGLSVCTQDFGQYQGLNGTGSQTCEARTIHTDNHAPAAPTGLRILTPDRNRYRSHFGASFDLAPDSGSPITEVHYEIVDASGRPVNGEHVLRGSNPTEIPAISGPASPGAYRLRVWLEDEVGHSGSAAEAAIPHDSMPPAAPQGLTVTPPGTPRGVQGFDVRWRNIVDDGSPIEAAHYRVVNAAGAEVVPTTTIRGPNVEAIDDLHTPSASGNYTLVLWLTDTDGNVGAAVTAPLAYGCVRSDVSGGHALSAGLGKRRRAKATVRQGKGSLLRGRLAGPGGGVAGAALCVFGRVVTESRPEFLGLAVSGPGGRYRFGVRAGASRELSVRYRSGHREAGAKALLRTVVRPTFKVRRKVVRNKHFARFAGHLPGPDNDDVVVVLQVKQGKGWRAFRRYRTRRGGRFTVGYRFTRTETPTKYVMRAQVRRQAGYPYLQGNSRRLAVIVLPRHNRRR